MQVWIVTPRPGSTVGHDTRVSGGEKEGCIMVMRITEVVVLVMVGTTWDVAFHH